MLNFISVYILNQAYCMIYSGHLWFLTAMTAWGPMTAWGLFLSHCIKLLVTCCPSSTTMCRVMHDIVWCVSLYISVFLCLFLPDWRINVFICFIVFSNPRSCVRTTTQATITSRILRFCAIPTYTRLFSPDQPGEISAWKARRAWLRTVQRMISIILINETYSNKTTEFTANAKYLK